MFRRWLQGASVAGWVSGLSAQGGVEMGADTNAIWLAEHDTKYEHRIPMRDGVRLFTRVYVPKEESQAFVNIPNAKPEEFRKATQRLSRGGDAASSLTVRVLPASRQ
jgi:predicted acyl esterase